MLKHSAEPHDSTSILEALPGKLDNRRCEPSILYVLYDVFQVIGIGAGQQSRIHCTRLAGDKANNW